jgi:hypothetical protein
MNHWGWGLLLGIVYGGFWLLYILFIHWTMNSKHYGIDASKHHESKKSTNVKYY